jgi:Flp pilus assembly CpaE family ATPase
MTTVLTAVGRWDSELATTLEPSRQVQIARRCADLADLLATAAAGLGTAAVVSGDLRGLDLSAVARLRAVGLHVVGISAPGEEGSERRLRQLGISTVVPAGSPLAQLESAILHPAAGPSAGGDLDHAGWPEDPFPASAEHGQVIDATPELEQIPAPGRVVAVWGPTGAPGRTTVAVNIATELAVLGVSTVLVDADTYGGSVAQSLSLLDEAPGLAAAARAAEQGRLDLPTLARLSPQLPGGMRVITGIPKAERWPEIRPAALERVLELARSLAEVVVVDCGFNLEDDEELSYDTLAPRRNAATLTTLSAADELLAIGSCDPVGLQRLVRGLQELGTVPSPSPRVVVNRARSSSVGSRPESRVSEALARFAGVERVEFVPDDPRALDTAVREGRTLAECAPGSPARAALRALAASLAASVTGDRVRP